MTIQTPWFQDKTLTPDEVQSILDHVYDLMAKTCLSLVYCCALRLSEVATLRIADFNCCEQRLVIRCGEGGNSRQIQIPKTAMLLLTNWLNTICPDIWMFPCNESHITVSALEKAFKIALRESGIQKQVVAYALRPSSVRNYYSNFDPGQAPKLDTSLL
jgi:integrase